MAQISVVLADPMACIRAVYLTARMFCQGTQDTKINPTPAGDCGFRRNGVKFELLWYGRVVVSGSSKDDFLDRVDVWVRRMSDPRRVLFALGIVRVQEEG
jgi:hypothetical protein